jgi:hypothetical protein
MPRDPVPCTCPLVEGVKPEAAARIHSSVVIKLKIVSSAEESMKKVSEDNGTAG